MTAGFAEVTVVCEPTPMLAERIATGDIDLAIITHVESRGQGEIIRIEPLLWVTSARHTVHEEDPLPLALGRPTCNWRQAAVDALEAKGRRFRVLYASWNSTAVGAAVVAGLAVSVLPESAVRPGMRILGPAEGFATLPSCKIGLLRTRFDPSVLSNALAGLRATDHNLIDLMKLYGASRFQVLWRLQLPGALPQILTGMKIAGGLSLIGAVTAEFVAGSGNDLGLGWTITLASRNLDTAQVFAALALLSILGVAILFAMTGLEWLLLHRWHESAVKREG